VNLIDEAGLMKTVWGLGDCYEQLVREFIVNVPEDCDNPQSPEYHKVFVRGLLVNFSPSIINEFLGRDDARTPEVELTDGDLAKAITNGLVKQWPKGKKVSSSKLSVKFACLNKIGTVNWVPTVHTSDISTDLARLIYTIGSKVKYDYGSYIFNQTLKHADSMAIKKPIAFPSLLCGIILSQQPGILRSSDFPMKRKAPLILHSKLFEGTHAPDIATASVQRSSAALTRKDMIAELKATCKGLEDQKLKLEAVIQALELEEAGAGINAVDDGGEPVIEGSDESLSE
jgi:hypothetical protein